MPSSRLDIDLSSIDRNLSVVRKVITQDIAGSTASKNTQSKVGVCAVLKQDAYGAGAARIGKRLAGTGVESIAVYSLDEARAIADAVPTVPILVLMPVLGIDRMDPLYRIAAAGRLHLTVHSMDQLAGISEMAARIGATIPLHVQVDTGLSRGGVMPEQARPIVEKVVASQKIRLGGLMTHFAAPCCDDQFTREQARLFRDFVQSVAPIIKAGVEQGAKGATRADQLALHAANSCATFRSRSYHGTMVRVGQGLLGYGAEDIGAGAGFEFASQFHALEPAVRWTSSVVHVQEIPAGWAVGYGSTWRAPLRADGRKTRVAVVPVGYADGYPRSLGTGSGGRHGMVGFTGRAFERRGGAETDDAGKPTESGQSMPTVYAPVVGRVSMDQITIDVTDVPEAYLKVGKAGGGEGGPEVELYSRTRGTPNFLPTLAERANAITHELLCRVHPKVERVYRYPAGVESTPKIKTTGVGNLTSGAGGGIGGATAVAR